MFSPISVGPPEFFFGQPTQNIPAGVSDFVARANSFFNSAFDFVKTMAKSREDLSLPLLSISQSANEERSSERTSSGKLRKCVRKPALIPSFFGSGVPEYPGMKN